MRIHLRNMRKSLTADALFPQTRQKILAATVMFPDRWWYLSDLARHLGGYPPLVSNASSTRLCKPVFYRTIKKGGTFIIAQIPIARFWRSFKA